MNKVHVHVQVQDATTVASDPCTGFWTPALAGGGYVPQDAAAVALANACSNPSVVDGGGVGICDVVQVNTMYQVCYPNATDFTKAADEELDKFRSKYMQFHFGTLPPVALTDNCAHMVGSNQDTSAV